MTNALDNVLAQAEAAAQAFVPITNENALTIAGNQQQPTALSAPSMTSILTSGGMTVDEYLQPKAEGFRISRDMKGLLEEVIVDIDMTEIVPIWCTRHESGGNAKFLRSYDGVTTSDGRNFMAAVQAMTAQYVKSTEPYRSVEIPCELVEDVKDPKSAFIVHAGTMVGLTPSMTGFKHFQKFAKKLSKTDPSLLEKTLRVKLVHNKRTNSNNNEWGVIDYELLEVA